MTDVILTPELIHAGKSEAGGWNRGQLEAIGIPWSEIRIKGWMDRASGRVVTRAAYDMFLALTGQTNAKFRS